MTTGNPRSRRAARLAVWALLFGAAALPAAAQHDHAHTQPAQTRPGHQVPDHSFADVDQWVGVFDDPARDEWQKPAEVVKALGPRPGMTIADIGAGTGYFSIPLARAVAPGGRVLAIDTEQKMVDHVRERAAKEGVEGLAAILAAPDDPHIPPRSADRVLLVDTYHHIHDRIGYLQRLKAALAPGGEVVVVDFHKRDLPVGPPPEHKMDRQEVVDEFAAAGYRLAGEESFLPYQYFLRFAPAAP